jgi:hypothetical protein
MPGIGFVRLGVPFPAAQRRGVRGLSQVCGDLRRGQLFAHIPPPGAPLEGEVDIIVAVEPGQPLP